MDPIQFVTVYSSFVDMVHEAVKPEFFPVIDRLREIDPHDLVSPESCFYNKTHALGFVWSLFYREAQLMGLYDGE